MWTYINENQQAGARTVMLLQFRSHSKVKVHDRGYTMYKRVRTVSKYMGKVHGSQRDETENRVVRTEELESKHIRASIVERNVFSKAASGEDTVERVGFLEASVAQREGDHLSGVDV